MNQNRTTSGLSDFAARLRERVLNAERGTRNAEPPGSQTLVQTTCEADFNELSRELFALQFAHNPVYRRVCERHGTSPQTIKRWCDIPTLATAAFKEFEVTCLPPVQRARVFHSSGTTAERPSRHFHSAESLAVYEGSLWPWFARHVLSDSQWPIANRQGPGADGRLAISNWRLAILVPPPAQAPHSSLVHMFETVRVRWGASSLAFLGRAGDGGTWALDFKQTRATLEQADEAQTPLVLLGTAFSFVHLLDFLDGQELRFELPPGSRAMETGGYKGRSRTVPKAALHALITERLGVPPSHIVCEYGMSELSSQAYDGEVRRAAGGGRKDPRLFRFPPWARAQVISPESGREVAEGETGLLRVFDLANVFSVMAVQTEDLGVRRGDGFELLGRAAQAEPRGCSLLAS